MENLTEMSLELPYRSTAQTVAETSVCLLMDVVSLVGNLLVCLAVYRNIRLRTTTNLYIVALAISDLLSATFVMPLSAGVYIEGRWMYGQAVCELHAFFVNFVVFVTPSTMGVTAFNRYMRVVQTRHYDKIFSPKRSRLVLVMVWTLIASYVAIPRLTGWYEFGFIPGYTSCHVISLTESRKFVHYCIVVSFFFVFPFAVALICYYKVFKVTRQHNLVMVLALGNNIQQGRRAVREVKINKSLSAVAMAFVLCWIPTAIIGLVSRFKKASDTPRDLQMVSVYLIYLSSAVNPFIYAGMSNYFRREFRELLSCSKRGSRIFPAKTPGRARADTSDLQTRGGIELQSVIPRNRDLLSRLDGTSKHLRRTRTCREKDFHQDNTKHTKGRETEGFE